MAPMLLRLPGLSELTDPPPEQVVRHTLTTRQPPSIKPREMRQRDGHVGVEMRVVQVRGQRGSVARIGERRMTGTRDSLCLSPSIGA